VILTFVVVVLGGIGSVGGSLLAGFGLGMFTALFGALVARLHDGGGASCCCWPRWHPSAG
jgi:branched-chain amino acid transport system permease protein